MDYGSTFEYYSKRWSGEDAWDPRSHRCLCNLPDAPWLRWTHRVPPQVDPIILWCLYLHLWNVYWKGAFENIATYWYNYSQLFTFFSLVYNLLIGLLLEITTIWLELLSTLLWCIFSSQSLLKCHHLKIAHYLYLIILGVSAIWRKIAFTLGSENYTSTIQLYYESQQVSWRLSLDNWNQREISLGILVLDLWAL